MNTLNMTKNDTASQSHDEIAECESVILAVSDFDAKISDKTAELAGIRGPRGALPLTISTVESISRLKHFITDLEEARRANEIRARRVGASVAIQCHALYKTIRAQAEKNLHTSQTQFVAKAGRLFAEGDQIYVANMSTAVRAEGAFLDSIPTCNLSGDEDEEGPILHRDIPLVSVLPTYRRLIAAHVEVKARAASLSKASA
jgi:hypothetical protein